MKWKLWGLIIVCFCLSFYIFTLLQRLGKPICAYWAFEQLTYAAVDYSF